MAKNIIFFGDSIFDSRRDRTEPDCTMPSYGWGCVFLIASELLSKYPNEYAVFNRGNSGDRIYNLYGRLTPDVWNLKPDVLTINVGINDVEHPNQIRGGTDIKRFEKIYRDIIEETKERFTSVRIILCEPYAIKIDEETPKNYFWYNNMIPVYRELLEKLCSEYSLELVALNDIMNEKAEKYGKENVTLDGTHPNMLGAKTIAEEWLKVFFSK